MFIDLLVLPKAPPCFLPVPALFRVAFAISNLPNTSTMCTRSIQGLFDFLGIFSPGMPVAGYAYTKYSMYTIAGSSLSITHGGA